VFFPSHRGNITTITTITTLLGCFDAIVSTAMP